MRNLFFCSFLLCVSVDVFALCLRGGEGIQSLFFSAGKHFILEHGKTSGIYETDFVNRKKIFLSDDDIGHQGFSIAQDHHYVWTSKKKSPYDGMLFYVRDGNVLNKTVVRFFDTSFFSKNEVMPILSSDGKYLIVRGRRDYRDMVFRVFDVNNIKSDLSDGSFIDLSNKYLYQWSMSSQYLTDSVGRLQPLQGIALNEQFVYILFGDSKITYKYILKMSIRGDVLSYYKCHFSMDEIIRPDKRTERFEPEGITIIDGKVAVLIISGRAGHRIACIQFLDSCGIN